MQDTKQIEKELAKQPLPQGKYIIKETEGYYVSASGETLTSDEFKTAEQQGRLKPGTYRYKDKYNFRKGLVEISMPSLSNEEFQPFTEYLIIIFHFIKTNLKDLSNKKEALRSLISKNPKFVAKTLMQFLPDIKDEQFYYLNPQFKVTKAELRIIIKLLMECTTGYDQLISSKIPLQRALSFFDVVGQDINQYKHKIAYFLAGLFTRINNYVFLNITEVDSRSSLLPIHMKTNIGQELSSDAMMRIHAIFNNPSIDVNCQDDFCGDTFLHICIRSGFEFNHQVIINLYNICRKAQRQFNFCVQNHNGETPLLLAIRTRDIKAVQAILNLQTNNQINVGINITDQGGRTPLMYAALLGCYELFEDMLRCGANYLLTDKSGASVIDYLNMPASVIIEFCEEADVAHVRSKNAFSSWLRTEESNLLLMVDEQKNEFRIPLSHTSWTLIQEWLTKIKITDNKLYVTVMEQFAPLLKHKDSDVSFLQNCLKQRDIGRNILRLHIFRHAAALGEISIIHKLIQEGIDIDAQDSQKRTALHFALYRTQLVMNLLRTISSSRTVEECLSNHLAVFRLLLENKADLFKANSNGNTPGTIICREVGKIDTQDSTNIEKATYVDIVLFLVKFIEEKLGKKSKESHGNVESYINLLNDIFKPLLNNLNNIVKEDWQTYQIVYDTNIDKLVLIFINKTTAQNSLKKDQAMREVVENLKNYKSGKISIQFELISENNSVQLVITNLTELLIHYYRTPLRLCDTPVLNKGNI